MIVVIHFVFLIIKQFLLKKREPRIVKVTNNFIVVDKSYDLKINSNDPKEVTLQTFLKKKFPKLASQKLYHEFYFVHRLDFSTSGIMCIPLNKETCKAIALAFQDRCTEKYYIALVRGWCSFEFIDVDTPIGEDKRNTEIQKMCCDKRFYINPKTSRSLIILLERGIFNNYPASKLLIRPLSGRRHQIRAHCNYLGHTIVGDFTYSNRKDVDPLRMYLHSMRLVIPSVDHIDVETEDPFSCDKNWNTIEVINKFSCDIIEKFKLIKEFQEMSILN